jgi:hypothetical protein
MRAATDRAPSRFDRHPILCTLIVLAFALAVALLGTEVVLRLMGLGDPIVYQTHPDYGYRPRPNQLARRFGGATVQINNLGIRATEDWHTPANKVLFIGDSVTYGGSYVSTRDLFALRAIPEGSGWSGGSAGVNAWGVENMHGLVVRHQFVPARVFVTVLIDVDFYRGFSQRPIFFRTTKPILALEEAIPHAVVGVTRYLFPRPPLAQQTRRDTAQRAVKRLMEIDDFLRARGFVHLIYLSPTRLNLERRVPADAIVAGALERTSLWVRRLQDAKKLARLEMGAIESLYHDGVHLSRRGHEVWASIMRRDLEVAIAMANRSRKRGD